MRETLVKGCKLLLFVVLLPSLLTYCHLCFTFQRQGLLLVESLPNDRQSSIKSSLLQSTSGIYWSLSPQLGGSKNAGVTYVQQEENSYSQRRKIFGILPSWPSISQVAASLVGQRRQSSTTNQSFRLEYRRQNQNYCFTNSVIAICPSDDSSNVAANDINNGSDDRFFPPAFAQWKVIQAKDKAQVGSEELAIPLRIQSFSFFKKYYFMQEEKPFQQLFQRPATSLLLACNIGLAFVYWNYRVNPNSVALMDPPMLQQFQYWRGITGTLAHFEWWHLLFNMMSLHNLGQFLEDKYYGSINFLLYNLALIPVTVILFVGSLQFIYWYRVTRLHMTTINRPSVNAVGYSGVLFAWMVVSSLEQTKSCPIPFWSDLCFDTWHLTRNIKFNIGPMIQLVIAQMILPRVSFGGHLAGIVAGFLLHWNLLPLEWVQPSVLIPLITLVQWRLRQYLPLNKSDSNTNNNYLTIASSSRNFLDEAGFDDDVEDGKHQEDKDGSNNISSIPSSNPYLPCSHDNKRLTGMSHLLSTLFHAMVLLFVCSMAILSWGSSLLYSHGLLMVLFHVCFQAYCDHWNDHEGLHGSPEVLPKKQPMLVLWRGFVTCCVLVLVMESMTLTSWILMGTALFSPFSYAVALSILGAHMMIHLMSLCAACQHMGDIMGEESNINGNHNNKGIFEYLFGYCVVDNAKVLGQNLVAFWIGSVTCRRLQRTVSNNVASSGHHHHHHHPSSTTASGTTNGTLVDRERAKNLAAAAAERRARAAQESELV